MVKHEGFLSLKKKNRSYGINFEVSSTLLMCKEKTTLSGTISSPVVCLDIWLSYLYVLGSVNKQMTSRRK